jgi:PIN domain nuclease of toxin-antitoxin system
VIVLDSHVIAWLTLAPTNLSKPAAEAIRASREGGEPSAISACTLYEFALMVARNRIGTNLPLEQLIKELAANFVILPLTPEIAVVAAKMPDGFPRDPFDRIIAATALVHGAPLVTADGPIRRSAAVATIW